MIVKICISANTITGECSCSGNSPGTGLSLATCNAECKATEKAHWTCPDESHAVENEGCTLKTGSCSGVANPCWDFVTTDTVDKEIQRQYCNNGTHSTGAVKACNRKCSNDKEHYDLSASCTLEGSICVKNYNIKDKYKPTGIYERDKMYYAFCNVFCI